MQTVDVVAMTTEQRAGTLGKGINGSIGMIGDDLYLPENQGFTVVKGISACPTSGQVCPTIPLNIAQFGFIFGSAIGVDPDPQHLRSTAGLVYAAVSPGAANGTLYQYDVATNTARVYAARGQLPPAGSPRRPSTAPPPAPGPSTRPTPRADRGVPVRAGTDGGGRRLGVSHRGRLRRRPRRPRPRLGRPR